MRRNGRVRNKWNAAAPRREGLGEKEETRMRCMTEEDGCFATQMECKVGRRRRRMGRSEAAGRRAGRHLRICMAERTEGGRERTKDHVPTYNRPRKRVSEW